MVDLPVEVGAGLGRTQLNVAARATITKSWFRCFMKSIRHAISAWQCADILCFKRIPRLDRFAVVKTARTTSPFTGLISYDSRCRTRGGGAPPEFRPRPARGGGPLGNSAAALDRQRV